MISGMYICCQQIKSATFASQRIVASLTITYGKTYVQNVSLIWYNHVYRDDTEMIVAILYTLLKCHWGQDQSSLS